MSKQAKALLYIVLFLALGAGFWFYTARQASTTEEPRTANPEGFGTIETVEIDGVRYQKRSGLTKLLIIGTDTQTTTSDTVAERYRAGDQADFLLLLLIDSKNESISQLQIDRDTLTEVPILGVFGNDAGTRLTQISLSHYFGETATEQALNTVKATENLLPGLEVDGYYAVNYTAVGPFADALGGVTVTITDDLTSISPSFTAGAQVTLRGSEAEEYVRARRNVTDGTNRARMQRQQGFMESAIERMKTLLQAQGTFAAGLMNTMAPYATTNLQQLKLVSLMTQCASYTVQTVECLPGTWATVDGFTTFTPEAGAATAWVTEHLYTPVQ